MKRKIIDNIEQITFFKVIGYVILSSFCIGIVALVVSFLASELVNCILNERKFVKYIIFATVIFILSMTVYYFSKHECQKEIYTIKREINSRIFDALINNSFEDVERNEKGNVITSIKDDSENVTAFIEKDFPNLCESVIVGIMMGICTFSIDKLLLVIVLILSFLSGSSIFLSKKIEKLEEKTCDNKDKLNSLTSDYFKLIPIMDIFVNSTKIENEIKKIIKDDAENTKEKNYLSAYYNIIGRACSIFRELFVILYGYYCSHLDVGTIIALLNITSFFNEIVNEMGLLFIKYSKFKVSVCRIGEFYSNEKECIVRVDCPEEKAKSLKINKLSYSYNNGDGISDFYCNLTNQNMNIFIGNVGVGKSTIGRCIAGIIEPITGEIFVNGLIQDKSTLRSRCAYVDQDAVIMIGNILDNITSFADKPDIKFVHQIIEKVGLRDWVKNLENGIYTEISDDNLKISGGQKQRIAIGRALYKRGDIILLDEPTSALDDVNAKLIIDILKKISLEKLTVVITHDERIIYDVDPFIKCINVG